MQREARTAGRLQDAGKGGLDASLNAVNAADLKGGLTVMQMSDHDVVFVS